jgi:CO dehydrogenase maturation factor
MRIAVVGKGGAGKSVIAGTAARLLARQGRRVLALDSDLLPGLSISLGSGPDPVEPPLNKAAERGENGRWRLRDGVTVVSGVKRYTTEAPDGIRLMQIGKGGKDGIQSIMGAINAYYKMIHRLGDAKTFEGWDMVGDLPAGPRQVAFDYAPFARAYVVVVQPGSQSALTGRRVAKIARMRGGTEVRFVANRVKGKRDTALVERLLGERVFWSLPADEGVAEAERLGIAQVDHVPDSPTIAGIAEMVAALDSLDADSSQRLLEQR